LIFVLTLAHNVDDEVELRKIEIKLSNNYRNIEILLNELIDRLDLKTEKISDKTRVITKMNSYPSYDEEEDEEEKRDFDFYETFEKRQPEIIKLK
jgi:hypothetical protein